MTATDNETHDEDGRTAKEDHASSVDTISKENSIKSKFNELSNEKQFALITLTALGTAMLVTGRTVRVIMKRMATADGPQQATVVGHNPTQLARTELEGAKSPSDLRTSKTMKTSTRFWDNKSLLCTAERREEDEHMNTSRMDGEKAMDFNPAMDGMKAFGLATLLVIGTSALTIGGLSKRWELDGWEDWRIFIQAGHLGKQLIPSHWNQSVSEAIPPRLRPHPPSLSDQQLADNLTRGWDWKNSLDLEWEVEKNRRNAERLQWETQRRASGKRIW